MAWLRGSVCVILVLVGCTRTTGGADGPPTYEPDCTDGIDEDLDGATDCEDSDCTFEVDLVGWCVNEFDLQAYEDYDPYDYWVCIEWNFCFPPSTVFGYHTDCYQACLNNHDLGFSPDCQPCLANYAACQVYGAPDCEALLTDCFGTLQCPRETGCRDLIDNDGDGDTDGDDSEC